MRVLRERQVLMEREKPVVLQRIQDDPRSFRVGFAECGWYFDTLGEACAFILGRFDHVVPADFDL